MANNMIALQVRAPQSTGLGSAIQQNAQMINMLAQQRTAERQNALAAQKLALDLEAAQRAANKEMRDIKAADIELAGKQLDYHYKRATAVLTPQGYSAWLAGVRNDSPEFADYFMANMPPEQFNRDNLIKMVGGIKENFDATYAPREAKLTYGTRGEMQETRTGGFEDQGVYPLQLFNMSQPKTGTVEMGEQTTVEPSVGGPDLPMPNAPTMPGVGPSRVKTDIASLLLNARNDPEYQQALKLIGGMDQQAAQELRQIMPTFQPELMDTIRAEAQTAFGGQAAQPSVTDFPLVAGPRGGPYVATGQQAYGKPPLQSPAPGTNIQTLPRIAGEAGATESGKQGVRVRTEPVIAGGTKAAELRAQRDDQYPEATGRMKANLARIDNIIETAKALRAHPAYRRIIGPLDAFTPNLTAGARGAQELYKTLSSLGATDELQKMRQESPTGGAVGNASDADIQLLREGFGALGQSQGEEDFDKSLISLINRAMQTRARITGQYKDTYNYRLPKNWTPPAVAKTRPGTPTGKGRKAGEFIVMEPE